MFTSGLHLPHHGPAQISAKTLAADPSVSPHWTALALAVVKASGTATKTAKEVEATQGMLAASAAASVSTRLTHLKKTIEDPHKDLDEVRVREVGGIGSTADHTSQLAGGEGHHLGQGPGAHRDARSAQTGHGGEC